MQAHHATQYPQGVRTIHEEPTDISKAHDHAGRDLEMKLEDPVASVCPGCHQGGVDIHEATTDIREAKEHTDTDLAYMT